jgi:hypothetical protein
MASGKFFLLLSSFLLFFVSLHPKYGNSINYGRNQETICTETDGYQSHQVAA